MPILRSLTISAALVATSLAVSAQASTPASHPAPRHAAPRSEPPKQAACERVWAAQKVRHGTRQAFVAACVAKG